MLKRKSLVSSLSVLLCLIFAPYTASADWLKIKKWIAKEAKVPVVVVEKAADQQIARTTGLPPKPVRKAVEQVPKNFGDAVFASINLSTATQAVLKSRDEHVERGVRAIPANIRAAFQGFYSEEVLNATWRIGLGKDHLPPSMALKYGSKEAIVMVDVIIFKNANHLNNLGLWAHELAHVEQYRKWGPMAFVTTYLQNYDEIERQADERMMEFRAFQAAATATATATANQSIGIATGSNGRASLSERITIQ